MRKRGVMSEKGGAESRVRVIGTNSPLSTTDFIDCNSMLQAQEIMDSVMVQEILGSVDRHHVRETQVLLHSFNWDMDELLQSEIDTMQGYRVS